MSLILRPAQLRIQPFGGPWPGEGRDLVTTPLSGEEEEIIDRLKEMIARAEKPLSRHGLAFERVEATTENPRGVGKYRGGWYECADCKKFDAKTAVCLEWNSGAGILLEEEIAFEFPIYDQFKKRDVWHKKTLHVFTGWICHKCERARIKAKIEQRSKSPVAGKIIQIPQEVLEHVGADENS